LGRKEVKSQMEPDLKDIVDTFMGVCLRHLVDKGFVTESQIQGNWYSREASDRLEKRSFVAAAGIDNGGRPVVLFNRNMPLKAIIYSIPHEAVHLAQICKRDLKPLKGKSLWKGKVFGNLPGDDPNYFSGQPWEAEAQDLEKEVRAALFEKCPGMEDLLTSG